MRWSSAPSRPSNRPPIPAASAMARFSSAPSTRRSASAPGRRARTRSNRRQEGNARDAAPCCRPAAKGNKSTYGNRDMSDIQKVMNMIKEHDVKYVDFRFTDPRGKWQHLAHHIRTINEDFLAEGVMFDGSSIAG